jgi:dihydropteroate synthase
MGILNITEDSFWEGSRLGDSKTAIETALRMEADGADIIDIGGESTRPGSAYVSAEEEMRRVVPVIEGIRRRSSVPISVDTRKRSVMEAAWQAGADMVNDISALEDDPELAFFAAEKELPVILMHKRGTPDTMQDNVLYTDVVEEVSAYLTKRCAFAVSAGIRRDRIIIDPGIGFGKDTAANYALIAGTDRLVRTGFPVLMALSRKGCIGAVTGRPTAERLAGTLSAELVSVLLGASMVRVHDVRETVDMLAVLKALQVHSLQVPALQVHKQMTGAAESGDI